MKEKDIILGIKNLSIAFKRGKEFKNVVHNISFCVERGKTTAIVGESGSGKSVSSLAVMGLLDPKISKISTGSIVFYDRQGKMDEIAKDDKEAEEKKSFEKKEDLKEIRLDLSGEKQYREIRGKKIAMIFQEPMTALNPVKRCGTQVDEIMSAHFTVSKSEVKKKTLSLFKEVMLPDEERAYNSYPFELSGGQRQRVMIAMAIACNPDLLIADEPTTALDVTVQKSILQLLCSIQKKHRMSILFISHDLGVVNNIADNVVVLYQGRIVEQGECKKVFDHPDHPYTKGLIASLPPLDYKPERLPVVKDFLEGVTPDIHVIDRQESEERRRKIYMGSPLLSVKGLNIDYVLKKNWFGKIVKQFHAIDNISFDVYKGETFGLVGESGCGKTTIGRAIVRLVQSSSGKIVFKGNELSSMSQNQLHEVRRGIQIVFQDPYSSLNPRMTVGKSIEEPMLVYGMYDKQKRKDKTIEILESVGLGEEFYRRYPHELSGGQRQRIGIARALSMEPELIILDESVSALDVSVQAQVLNLLNDLKTKYGLSYIFISHNLSVVKYMSDRVMVLQKGKKVEENYPEELYENPSKEYTKKLISSIQK